MMTGNFNIVLAVAVVAWGTLPPGEAVYECDFGIDYSNGVSIRVCGSCSEIGRCREGVYTLEETCPSNKACTETKSGKACRPYSQVPECCHGTGVYACETTTTAEPTPADTTPTEPTPTEPTPPDTTPTEPTPTDTTSKPPLCTVANAFHVYPYESDCKKFYLCAPVGDLYKYLLSSCKPGFMFNAATGACDLPYNVENCPSELPICSPTDSVASTKPDCTEANLFQRYPHETDCTKYYLCQKTKTGSYYYVLVSCPPDRQFNVATSLCDSPDNVEKCPSELPICSPSDCVASTKPDCTEANLFQRYPHETDCKKYYLCQKTTTNSYHYVLISCQSDLLFNVATSLCDSPDNVENCPSELPICSPSDSVASTKPDCTEANLFQRYPHETDCKKYYICLFIAASTYGYVLKSCDLSLVFNPAKSGCDYAYNVEGCEAWRY